MRRILVVPGLGTVCRFLCFVLPTAAMCTLATGVTTDRANAQQLPGISTNQLQQIQQTLQSGGNENGGLQIQSGGQQPLPPPQVLLPTLPNNPQLPPSQIEQVMSSRAGVQLGQFGYDQVGVGQSITIPQTGTISDNYILGPGDQIVVSLRGQENSEFTTIVNRNGQVVLPRLSPIAAAGRTLGDFRRNLEQAVSKAYISTQIFVSIGSLRQISVLVTGEVQNPGTRIVTGLTSSLDAILLSGGVKKSGSLRNIKVVRGGRTIPLDLYNVLTQQGHATPFLLTDGDRIIVPPLGPTVAVAGWVRRPGIYELPAGASGISTRGLISLAGGLVVRSRYRLSVMRVQSSGVSRMESLAGESGTIHDSDILVANPAADQTEQQATLSGGTPLAGNYSVGNASSLASVLKSPGALGPSPYTLFGVISRRDPDTQMRALLAFTPLAVLNGTENQNLQSHDLVRVFSLSESRLMMAVISAFEQRRAAVNASLRTAQSVSSNLGTLSHTPDTSTLNLPSATQTAPPTSLQNAGLMQLQQLNLNQKNGITTERQDIADLSTMVLGDGGVLIPNPALAQQNANNASIASNTAATASNTAAGSAPPQGMSANGYSTQPAMPLQYPTTNTNQPMLTAAPNFQVAALRAGQVALNSEVTTFGDLATQLNVDPLMLIHFLMDNVATISGAVQDPGMYLVGPNANLKAMVAATGGTAGWADGSGVEVISTSVDAARGMAHTVRQRLSLRADTLQTVIVKPHDEIRFSNIYTTVNAGTVTINGNVRDPGSYQIERGERLSELLLRAGGLTDVAYPYGTVFLRQSAAQVEQEGYNRMADETESILVAAMTRLGGSNSSLSGDTFKTMQGFVTELRNTPALGRISVIADPALLAANPARDPLLEAGDVIYIPQRPSTVTVLGQVMQQGSFSFDPKASLNDYVQKAGGYNQFADSSLSFLVLPDGTARQVETSWLNLDSSNIPPGSTIVVPREAAVYDTRQMLFDALSAMQSLAVSAASLAVISRN